MMNKSVGTALVLTVATIVLSGGSCGGSSGGGDGEFFVQTFGDPPNSSLDEFLDEAVGERISITQHTGSLTLSETDVDVALAIVDFLFFEGVLPVPEGATGAAIADGSDENPAHFRLTNTEDNDFVFRIASTGDLEMEFTSDVEEPDVDPVITAETIDDTPAVGDDVADVRLTFPGEPGGGFGTLDFMSVVAWITVEVPAEDATEFTVDFGLGHIGLVTPEADIPTTGDADYVGEFVGIYLEPGDGADGFVAVATGFAAFTADFGEGTVEGGIDAIALVGTNLDGDPVVVVDAGGIEFEDVLISGNTFSGSVIPVFEDEFAGFDSDSEGTLDGTFYGPVDDVLNGSEEAGAVLTLENADGSGDFITGVIGASVD